MKSLFEAEFFTGNRRRLAEKAPGSIIFIAANGELQKNADEGFLFRQDSSFWYLTGLNIADAVLVMNTKNGQELLILPPREAHRDQWEGALEHAEITKRSGIENIQNYREGWQMASEWLAKTKVIHTLPAAPSRYYRFYGLHPNPARKRLLSKLKRMSSGLQIKSIRTEIKGLRIIKQPAELTAIKKAIRLTEAGYKAVAKERPKLKFEYEAQVVLEATFRRLGASGTGFDSVIASGRNAATIHYRDNNQPLRRQDMLLIDSGAQVEYYTADITRMFLPLDGLTKRQQEHLKAVQTVKKYAESIMKPGIAHRYYENLVRESMREQMLKLGLLKTPKQKVTWHLTSHHLGLDTHDIADYDEAFSPGMVLTIEPGIYNSEEGIGVRLEDDYLITETGCIKLSDGLPSSL